MAALAANPTPNLQPRPDPGIKVIERIFPVTAADEFYMGAVCTITNAAGTVSVTNANADWGLGFIRRRATTTAASQAVTVAISGIWWIVAAACADASLFLTIHPLATSDNSADVTATAAGNCGTLGILAHVDVTGTSGWIALSRRVLATNT